MVTTPLDPPHQHGFPVYVFSRQAVAVSRPSPSAKLIENDRAFLNIC
jgi:hypothetical protein